MMKLGRIEEALKLLDQAASYNQDKESMSNIYDAISQCYHKLKDYEQAYDNYSSAIEKNPRNVEIRKHRAQCSYDQGLYDEAIKDLYTALQQDTKDAETMYRVGVTYYAHQRFKKCCKFMKLALDNNPFRKY